MIEKGFLEYTARLPNDIELEEQVIGASMRDRGFALVAALKPDDFHEPLLADVWRAVLAVNAAGHEVTPISVLREIEARGGDRSALAGRIIGYQADVLSMLAVPDYVSRLKDLAARRRAMYTLGGMLDALEDTTAGSVAEDQIGKAVSDLVAAAGDTRKLVGLAEIGDGYIAGKRGKVSSTGYPKLDVALAGGFHQNRYYGFAGKMKSGKTMFMGSISQNMVMRGTRHAYLCLEMRPEEIGQRYYARRMGVNSLSFFDEDRRNSPWFIERLVKARDYFRENDFVQFMPRSRMTLDDLRATIAGIGLSGKHDGVFVDYVQLVNGQKFGENATNHLDNVNQTLAEMAASYPLWIAAGAQLNDDGGVRGGKGMAAACDVLFNLEDSDPGDDFVTDDRGRKIERRHLSMEFSRYTMATDIGEKNRPGYRLRSDIGPYFEEL